MTGVQTCALPIFAFSVLNLNFIGFIIYFRKTFDWPSIWVYGKYIVLSSVFLQTKKSQIKIDLPHTKFIKNFVLLIIPWKRLYVNVKFFSSWKIFCNTKLIPNTATYRLSDTWLLPKHISSCLLSFDYTKFQIKNKAIFNSFVSRLL